VNQQTTPYREDTSKKDKRQAFLTRGSTSSAPSEDSPVIIVMAAPAAGEHGEACKTPSKRDIPVTTGTILRPCGLGDTNAWWGYGSGPVNGPVSIWGHVGWRAPMKFPSCWLKISPSEGRSSGNG
jgi:hypothetical protein